MASLLSVPSLTLEFLHVPFAVDDPEDIEGVELALTRPGVDPEDADWHAADWDEAVAKILVGPDTGVVEIEERKVYVAWLRATGTTEHPARPTGYVWANNLPS